MSDGGGGALVESYYAWWGAGVGPDLVAEFGGEEAEECECCAGGLLDGVWGMWGGQLTRDGRRVSCL